MKRPLIILAGPTAVGKTHLSIAVAKAVGGEVISADSMQVYRGMDIGTAKIRPEEMDGVPHHLIDVLSPEEEFHIVRFQAMAKEAMEGIYKRGHIPILVGGTGFYIQAILYDIDFTDACEDKGYRDELREYARREGEEALHGLLAKKDPEAAVKIHPNNVKKVIRALEFYKTTGKPISAHNKKQQEKSSPYRFLYLVLNEDREVLYEKIGRRVDQMMENGLLGEVRALKDRGLTKNMVSMKGLGYKEILSYLDGEMELSEAVSLLKKETRHFAKRQLTWFRREKEAVWMEKGDYEGEGQMLSHILLMLGEKNIWRKRSGDEVKRVL